MGMEFAYYSILSESLIWLNCIMFLSTIYNNLPLPTSRAHSAPKLFALDW